MLVHIYINSRFVMDTKLKSGCVVADEAITVETLSGKCCSSVLKSSCLFPL